MNTELVAERYSNTPPCGDSNLSLSGSNSHVLDRTVLLKSLLFLLSAAWALAACRLIGIGRFRRGWSGTATRRSLLLVGDLGALP